MAVCANVDSSCCKNRRINAILVTPILFVCIVLAGPNKTRQHDIFLNDLSPDLIILQTGSNKPETLVFENHDGIEPLGNDYSP